MEDEIRWRLANKDKEIEKLKGQVKEYKQDTNWFILMGIRIKKLSSKLDDDRKQLIDKAYELENKIAHVQNRSAEQENSTADYCLPRPAYKSAVKVSDIEELKGRGYSVKEIAEMLKCSPNTVRNRLKGKGDK